LKKDKTSNFQIKTILSILWPPSSILKQFISILLFKHLIKWKYFYKWLFKYSFKTIPVAAGAWGMGCIGYPPHPVWEITNACNLNCIHCHAAGGKPAKDELTTEEGKKLIDEIARMKEFKTLVYSGGEPLMRPDLIELLNYSKKAGLINIIATNGTLITEDMAFKLKQSGVFCVAVSLDSSDPNIHNFIRKHPEAFSKAVQGIKNAAKAGILIQINTTAMEYNFETLGKLLEMGEDLGTGIYLMYQLVPVGRGNKIEDASLKVNKNEKLLKFLAEKQKNISAIVEPVAGPQYWPYLLEKNNKTSPFWRFIAERVFFGCAAGRGFIYIKANGDIWPCPFVEVNAGNIREQSLEYIYKNSTVLNNLRNRENTLKGKCKTCKYRKMCGGCRGRAWAYTGDYLAEDPSCFLNNLGVRS